jgi:hypothetical protein
MSDIRLVRSSFFICILPAIDDFKYAKLYQFK